MLQLVCDGVVVEAADGILDEECHELVRQEQQLWTQSCKQLGKVELNLDGDEIVVKAYEKSPITRIRRITGYLSCVSNFNAGKRAEEHDRIVHGCCR